MIIETLLTLATKSVEAKATMNVEQNYVRSSVSQSDSCRPKALFACCYAVVLTSKMAM